MHISVITPEEEYFQGKIESVKVPGTSGEFQVLKGHAPIVSSLVEGKVEIRQEGGKTMSFQIVGGFVEVLDDAVALLVNGITNSSKPQ
ncbi:MAG TPA: ATP synthase F1 subunit epsilon [Saprospiraceae bacterium]|nr:ATP synthase F1 subunit epsilon [Saprospiraceae bacterium]HQW55275.1 ATP synthase F1 subunit epsilon [Saprospiraceae bacterium]